MPVFKATTKSSREVWASPDRQRILSEVTMDVEGAGEAIAKTYSSDIVKVGWSGEVETYEKPDNRGNIETFVKQPQKENGYKGGGGGGKGGRQNDDPYTMYLAYAKDVAVAMVMGAGFDQDEFTKVLGAISAGGEMLMAAHTEVTETQELTKEALNKVFGDDDNFAVEGEKAPDPWKNPPRQ